VSSAFEAVVVHPESLSSDERSKHRCSCNTAIDRRIEPAFLFEGLSLLLFCR